MTTPEKLTFDTVIEAMLDEDVAPTHQALVAWTARYPAFTQDLADYFAAWAIQDEADESVDRPAFEHFANRGVSEALNLLHMQKAAELAPDAQPRLSDLARKAALSDQDVAARTGIDEGIFLKLDRGRIVPISGVPRLLVSLLAEVLGASADLIWGAIGLPPKVTSRGGLLKSRKKAVVAVETFEQALDSSTLPSQSRAHWRRAIQEGTGPP